MSLIRIYRIAAIQDLNENGLKCINCELFSLFLEVSCALRITIQDAIEHTQTLIQVKSLCLIKYRAVKSSGGVEV
jgi:hypothetical protein